MAIRIRKNGIQCPWSTYQILSWLSYIFSVLVFYLQISPCYTFYTRISINLAIALTLCLIIWYLIMLTISDPSDPLVTAYMTSKDLSYKKSLSDSTTRHCNYCDSPVSGISTKHCLRCNRCTIQFDHHCKFVNNCVGKNNYTLFFKLIVSVQIHECFVCAIILHFLIINSENYTEYYIFIFGALLKSALVWVLNGYLIGFHLFLLKKKMTTYEYIVVRRKAKACVSPNQNMSDTNIMY
ncbi:hypothetical protein SteCoe_36706 [Stentor coeruleus]|uniref:Palmitoyltransferase n=1 Tax=Stentor coeruleus TaxID=5963 RepID=A0A1R2APH4_9CILI|nr:hypothetical protein SteCoe_36706 [Stentor coeruleus]